jgi:thiol-disulfide isomerase/thioredoxin
VSQGNKQQRVARLRAQEAIAERRRAEARKRKRLVIAGSAVAAIVLIALTAVIVKVATDSPKKSGAAATAASNDVVAKVTGVPAATLDKIGKGSITSTPKAITGQPVLTADGKPLVVYMGAEYCPFCAAERWAMVVALSRFGTFSNLGQTASSPNDTFPNTPTLTFHGSTYTSKYLSFQGVEMQSNEIEGNSYKTLDTPTAQQQELINKFDAPPYVDKNSTGSIPFIDFANQAMVSGSSYSPQLFAGKTQQQVADALQDPNSDIAKAVGGAANAFTAQLCKLTNNQPADICSSAAAQAYSGQS